MVTLPAHLTTLHHRRRRLPLPLPLPLDHFQEEMSGVVVTTVVEEEMMIESVGIIGTATAAVHHQLTMKIVGRGETRHHHVTTIMIETIAVVVGQVVEGATVEETTVTIEEGTEVTVEEEEVMKKDSNIINHQNKIITTTVMDGKGKSVSNIIADQHRQDHLEMIPSATSRVELEHLLVTIIV